MVCANARLDLRLDLLTNRGGRKNVYSSLLSTQSLVFCC